MTRSTVLALGVILALLSGCRQKPAAVTGGGGQTGEVVTVTGASFDRVVAKSEKPVLVDFWAQWCGPCRQMGPIVDSIASDFEGKVVVGKVNVDEERDLAQKFGVRSIPTLILFKDGQPVEQSVGLKEKAEVAEMIERALR